MSNEKKSVDEQVIDALAEVKSTQEKMVTDNAKALEAKTAELTEAFEAKTKALDEKEAESKSSLETIMTRIETLGAGSKGEDEDDSEHKAAISSYIRTGNETEIKALSEGVDPEGGYTVSAATSAFVVSRNFETSPVRQLARSETISSDTLEMLIDDDELEVAKVAEKGGRAVTDNPLFGLKKIHMKEYIAQPKATQRLLDDSEVNIEQWLAEKANRDIARKENTDFINGDGVNGARGILSYPAWSVAGEYERNKLERINSGASALFTVDGLIDLQNSLKEVYQARATFMTKRANFGSIMKLKSTDHFHFLGLQPTDRANNTFTMSLLGKPVVFGDDIPALGADVDGMIYGDFSVGYTVVDHSAGMRVLRDPFSNKPFILFYTTKRTGGDVTNFEALKIQKLSA